ncbi:hypothetical protein [Halobaculum sp. P14]|uniref:hypothetical protein n=1 Tax=Halobaculum sp. P14 TaxID=3421638 RepID=UPI003EB7116D
MTEQRSSAPDTRFLQVDSFEFGDPVAAAGGDDAVVVADDTGAVEAVRTDGHQVLTDADGVDDVAVGGRAYVLAGDALEAYSLEGSRVWGAEIAGAESVDADPTTDTVFVRTGGGEFAVFDGRSGVERDRLDQPHADVAEAPSVAAYDGRLGVAAWSFLTVIDDDGDVQTEVSLDGAATAVGLLDDLVVVALKDGRLAGYTDDGELRWTLDVDADWLAPKAAAWLPGRGNAGVFGVDPDGSRLGVDGVSGRGTAASTVGSDLLCELDGATATVYALTGETDGTVSVDVVSDSCTKSDGTVAVEFTNDGDVTVEPEVTVDADRATPTSSVLTVTLDPGETRRRRVVLREFDEDADSVDVTVGVDGETTTESVDVTEATAALAVETGAMRVDRGTLSVEVDVANDGTAAVDGVRVGGRDVGTVSAGETKTVTVETPLPAGDLTVEAAGVDPEPVELDVPTVPTDIEVDATGDGFVAVTLRNDTPADATDDLTVRNAQAADVEHSRSVELAAHGAYRLLLPVVEDGSRDVVVETSGGRLTEPLTLERSDLLPDPAGSNRGSSSRAVSESADSLAAPEPDPGSGPAAAGSTGAPVSVERSFASTPRRGITFEEKLVVDNDGDQPVEFTLSADDGGYEETLSVRGRSTAYGRRYHVAYGDRVSVPPVRLRGDWGTIEEDGAEFAVEASPVVPLLTWRDRADGGATLTYSLETDGGNWSFSELVFPDTDVQVPVDIDAAGGTATGEVDLPVQPDRRVVVAKLVGQVGADRQTVRTLCPHESLVGDDDASALADVDVALQTDSRVVDGRGALFVELTNAGGDVSGVTVEASGGAVDDTMYVPQTVESFGAGESVEHIVDVDGVDGGDAVTVTLTLTADGADADERTVTVAASADGDGDIPSDAWRIEDDAGGHGRDLPDRLSTAYR